MKPFGSSGLENIERVSPESLICAMLAKTRQCKKFPFSLAVQGCASSSLKADCAEQETLSAGHFGFWWNFLNLGFLVFLPLSSLFWWWSSAVYFSQCWACLAPRAVLGERALAQAGQQLLPAHCSPSWTGSLERLCWHWRWGSCQCGWPH